MISNRKKSGFTVTELVIVMTLTVIVLGIIWTMFSISTKIISDVTIKSDLQREGQAIQEQLSNIGMQATEIGTFSKNDSENIQTMQINSYYKPENLSYQSEDSPNPFYIIYDKEKLKLYKYSIGNSINTSRVNRELLSNSNYKLLSSNVESVKINGQDISEVNESILRNINSIEFLVTLRRNRNYNNEPITYVIKVKTVFRNKDKT